MSLVASEMTPADIAAVTGGGNSGNGGWGMNDGSWLIILFLFAILGWGNGGWGGNGGANGGGNGFVPYYLANNTDNGVQAGFNNAAIAGQLNGIQSAITNGFSTAEVASCNRAMNDLERSFASQTAITSGMTGISAQLANCCCENRLAVANLGAQIASEACADRAAVTDGVRDILASQNAGIQRILDQLCNDKIDAKNERIADLERQLTMANLAASQTAQTAQLLADNNRQTVALEQYLNPVPVPAYVVQNPNCCSNPCGTNCGCGIG